MAESSSTGKWFGLGGRAEEPPAQASRFPSLPNVNIPGFRREVGEPSAWLYVHACRRRRSLASRRRCCLFALMLGFYPS